jgi:hypothetical protein
MENFTGLIFFFLLFGFIIFITYWQSENMKGIIKQEVEAQGGDDVEISYKWGGSSKNSYDYEVTFTGVYGPRHQTYCKVQQNNKRLFWTRSPHELILEERLLREDAKLFNQSARNVQADPKQLSSKEQIIADLTAENKRLKEELTHLKQESKLFGN